MMRLGRRVAAPAKSLLNRRTMSTQPKVSAPVDWWTFGAGAVFASAFIMINQDDEAGEEAHATTANVLSEAAITSQSKFSLSVLSDAANLQKILVAGGMTEDVAAGKAGLFQDAARKLIKAGHNSSTMATGYWVPGRIEVVGKHTDYAGGRSLLGAVSKGFCIVSVDRDDDKCRILTTLGKTDAECTIPMDGTADASKMEGNAGNWALYPVTTINRLVSNFGVNKGVDFAIGNDIPGASGMSTSSAMVCAVFMVIAHRNEMHKSELYKKHLPTVEDLYGYLGCCENGQNYNELIGHKGVGTFGGSEDHTGIMSGSRGKLKMFSYCDTTYEKSFDFPEDMTFVIASSGHVAEKTGGSMEDYNNAAFLSFAAADAYADATGAQLARRTLAEVVKHARANAKKESFLGGAKDGDVMKYVMGKIDQVDDGNTYPKESDKKWPKGLLAPRFEQFYRESECIVAAVGESFAAKDLKRLGELVDESQSLTDTHLKNIVPATRALPKLARGLGAHAASAFGAGFGGSCWAAVDANKASEFSAAWKEKYLAEFPGNKDKALFFIMPPGPGAFRLGQVDKSFAID